MRTTLKTGAALLAALLLAGPAAAEPFTFAALGDMPYVRDNARVLDPEAPANRDFTALIERINRAHPAFAVHVGDTKAGGTACTDAHLAFIKGLFDRFAAPLVYTPGDNEWTDCHRRGGDPLERLAAIRRLYFSRPHSQGAAPMAVEQQAGVPENAQWTREGVVFATLDIPGSDNDRRIAEEYVARNTAALAWLAGTFERARATAAPAVVLFMQANPGWFCTRYECSGAANTGDGIAGYAELVAALTREVKAFGRPVLLVHGDTHVFTVDQPLKDGKAVLANFTRLEVFGEDDSHAILVTVDPAEPEVFSFRVLR